MAFHSDDTICAIASAPGGAARGIVRISGGSAVPIVGRFFEANDRRSLDTIRHATALPGQINIDLDSAPRLIPCDLFVWPTNRSFTREPIAEIHTIGSPSVVDSLMTAVCKAGARLAEPGEFTLRAFLAGRIDLTQAEAVLGVIDARRPDELRNALAQLAGGLARPLHQLRESLLQLLAELEAGLDFVEEDIEFVSRAELLGRLQSADELLANVAQQMSSRYVAVDTMQISLVGPPNAGKSSLFNALIERYGCPKGASLTHCAPALVSSQRGTTRDYLTAAISLDGVGCELIDTAGIDTDLCNGQEPFAASPDIGSAAQSHTANRQQAAAVRACCIEASAMPASMHPSDLLASVGAIESDIIILTKSDLASRTRLNPITGVEPIVVTSCRTGEGLDTLCGAFRKLLTRDAASDRGSVVAVTADRCRESIRLAASSIRSATDILNNKSGNELVAVELRAALDELGQVVGAIYTDDLLDRIFSTFCIGK